MDGTSVHEQSRSPAGVGSTDASAGVAVIPDRIRPMSASDLSAVAELHQESLEAGFFGRLGQRFLCRYYETFIASPHAVAFAIGDRPDGILVGTTHNALHYRWVMRHRGLRLAVAGTLALLLRPRVLADFMRTRLGRYLRGFRRVARESTPAAQPQREATSEQVAVLTHVAVWASVRRRGLGRILVGAFIEAARDKGADRALLVTLDDSAGSAHFYVSLGWDPIGSKQDSDGRLLRMFELHL